LASRSRHAPFLQQRQVGAGQKVVARDNVTAAHLVGWPARDIFVLRRECWQHELCSSRMEV